MMAAGQLQGPRMAELLAGLAEPAGLADWVPAGLSLDSRAMVEGGLFLACRGHRGHGLEHVTEAIERGAGAVAWEPGPGITPPQLSIPAVAVPDLARHAGLIADRFFGQPSTAMRVVGVTGTNGKSSVVHLLSHALEATGRPSGQLGTLGSGRPGKLTSSALTTGDAVAVQARLAEFRDAGVRSVAMEVSSHGLVQHRVDAVRFTGAIFTNLSHDHLDYHGSLQAYARAKRRLFAHPELDWAVINGADPEAGGMAEALASGVRCVRFGPDSSEVEVRAEPRAEGLSVSIRGSLGEARIETAWLGRFNADNIAAAFSALRLMGLEAAQAASELAAVPPVPGRMEAFGGGDRPLLVVDYAHTPDALEKVLAALREHVPGRLYCVFGCGGERDAAKRPRMGLVAVRGADRVVLTDDNPRGESGEQIIADILRGSGTRVAVTRDRESAIREAWNSARTGDVILVAGKGHEEEQIVGEKKIPFSDRELARSLAGEGVR